MNNIANLNRYLKAFYSDGFRLGMKVAENKNSQEILFDSIKKMYQNIDDLIESFGELAKQQQQKIDCKKGCEWCCHQPVFALDYELEYLQYFIKNNHESEKLKEIQKKAFEKEMKLKVLNNEKLLHSKHACPLLENGSCISYNARPMACRIYLSSDVNTCIDFYKNPKDKNRFPALLDFPMRAGRMMNEGFKAALKTNGIVSTEFRIEEKLAVLFE